MSFLYANHSFSNNAWVATLKKKKDIENTIDFQQNLDESCHKSNKAWVDKSNGFCNTSMKSWSQDNDVKIYSG